MSDADLGGHEDAVEVWFEPLDRCLMARGQLGERRPDLAAGWQVLPLVGTDGAAYRWFISIRMFDATGGAKPERHGAGLHCLVRVVRS